MTFDGQECPSYLSMSHLPEERAQVLLDVAEDEAIIPARRRQEDTEMDITPMIDITFLLLIFFIVASKLDSDASITLPTARHGNQVNMQEAIVVTVAATKDKDARIFLGDTTDAADEVRGSTPLEQEEQIMQYIADEIIADSQKRFIVVKAAGELHHRDVSRVAKAAGTAAAEASEGSQMYVAVMEET